MTDKEQKKEIKPQGFLKVPQRLDPAVFVKIKNTLFGGEMMGDYNKFAEDFGWASEKFWSEIGERSPTQGKGGLSKDLKGMIIYERIANEPSPERFVELCDVAYKTLAYADGLEGGDKKETYRWGAAQTFLHFLKQVFVQHDAKEFLYIKKIKDSYPVEANYISHAGGQPAAGEVPAELHIRYFGENFSEAESRDILMKGFHSSVLANYELSNNKTDQKFDFWKKTHPLYLVKTLLSGMWNFIRHPLIIKIAGGLIVAFLVYKFGWS